MIKHIRRWNIWRKENANGPIYQFMVLIKCVKSPTFELCLLPEEVDKIREALKKAAIDALKQIETIDNR